ncbi:MAG: hypothetical protein DYH20_04555 [Gammaproteobacteria bacterium PRO9]|nr:hypothetical protein [Gammaproteobacteria bacterium PRO9]
MPRLLRTSKGKRPKYFEDPTVDRLVAMLMSLVGEVSVLRERLDAVERLAERQGVFTLDEVDHFSPDTEANTARAEWRNAYLARIFQVLQMEREQMTGDRSMPPLEDIIRDFDEEKY